MYLVSPKRVFKGNKAWEKALPEISKLTKFPLIVGRSSSTDSLRQKIIQDLNLYNINTIDETLHFDCCEEDLNRIYKISSKNHCDAIIAAGEAFDKGARILGLGYPGGPEIEKCANNGDSQSVKFPRAFIETKTIEFSFSGLKTSLLYYMDSFNENNKYTLSDIAASYQSAIIDCLVAKIKLATKLTGVNTVSIAGGVAKNKLLRSSIEKNLYNNNIIFPELKYCTDNAAMISYLGEKKLKMGKKSTIDFSINPNFTDKLI